MKKTITVISMTMLLIGCGGSGSEGKDIIAASPAIGAALPAATDTNTLDIAQSFNFATARSIDVAFDIAAARNANASVSICTHYTPVGEEYDIDFDSCTLSGSLDNGTFNHTMEVTNDNDSVVGVILFQDAGMAPLYKEFTLDANQRTKGDGSLKPVIVWQ